MMSSGFSVSLCFSGPFPLSRPHSLAGSLTATIRVLAAPAVRPSLSTALPEIETFSQQSQQHSFLKLSLIGSY